MLCVLMMDPQLDTCLSQLRNNVLPIAAVMTLVALAIVEVQGSFW